MRLNGNRMNAYLKDILRTAKKNIRRLLAIMIMVILGVGINVGIPVACNSAYVSANKFYKDTKLFDIRIVSTLGLTTEDVEAISALDEVVYIFPCFSKSVKTKVEDKDVSVMVTLVSENMLNKPFVLNGRLPEKLNEVAVTSSYLHTEGKKIGDTVILNEKITEPETKVSSNDEDSFNIEIEEEQEETKNLLLNSFTIVGEVMSPTNTSISLDEGNPESNNFLFYLIKDSLSFDIFTDIYITVLGTEGLDCYSSTYKDIVDEAIDVISDTIKDSQMQLRYDSITGEALSKINDGEKELNEKEADAKKEIADAEIELKDGREKIADGEEEITDGWKEVYKNRKKLDDAQIELTNGEAELNDAKRKLEDGQVQYNNGVKQLSSRRASVTELQVGVEQIPPMIAMLSTMVPTPPDEAQFSYILNNIVQASSGASELMKLGGDEGTVAATNIETINSNAQNMASLGQYQMSYNIISNLSFFQTAMEMTVSEAKTQIAEATTILESSKGDIDKGFASIAEAEAKIASGKAEIADGRKQLQTAIKKLQDAEIELEDARLELIDGEKELEEAKIELAEKISEAQIVIDDAKLKVADIPFPKWYILDRTSIDSFVRLDNDVASIRAVCSVFPVIFLVVAVSVCLSSMTRLVEEERGIIGTLKALGYNNSRITMKYVTFAVVSCIFGGIFGGILGFSFFPKALWSILLMLHKFPVFILSRNIGYVVLGTVIYVVALAAATIYSSIKSLKSKPSELLRPKAPSKGSRILIEQIKILWNNLKFLGKVTARNLFRYKKRMFMTIFGVCTCTALIVTGFALKNSSIELVPKQFDTVSTYDMIVVFDDDEKETKDILLDYLKKDDRVEDSLLSRMGEITVLNEKGESLGIQTITLDTSIDYGTFFNLINDKTNNKITFDAKGILITENAAKILELDEGDSVVVRDSDNEEYDVTVNAIVHSFIGNSVYMSSEYAKELFGEVNSNTFFVHTTDGLENEDRSKIRDELLEIDNVLTVVNVNSIRSDFSDSIQVVDSVVVLLIVFATCLAFVVLYTLANINISERKREMATLKVLGFYNREIYQYVNRETIILALFGIILGLPAGRGIADFIMATIRMPSINMHVNIRPISYITAAAICFAFTLITNMFTNIVLKKLDMIESLKNIE